MTRFSIPGNDPKAQRLLETLLAACGYAVTEGEGGEGEFSLSLRQPELLERAVSKLCDEPEAGALGNLMGPPLYGGGREESGGIFRSLFDQTGGTEEEQSKRRSLLEELVEKRAHSLRTLSLAIEVSPLSVVITDRDGVIDYVNPQFTKTTGYTAKEAIGQPPRLLNSGYHSKAFFKVMWETLLSGRMWQDEIRNRKKSGALYWESTTITSVRNAGGEITHFVAIKEDVTAQKQLNADLRSAKESAEAANKAKSLFLANMSHEIRTPMNSILGFSQLMLAAPSLTPLQKQYLQTINRSGEHLLALINDILEMSKIEAGRMTLEPSSFDLHELLDELFGVFLPRVNAKNLRFNIEPIGEVPKYVIADERKLRQVLINLLNNAIKFTEEGGITLRVQAKEDESANLRLIVEVEDTGKGISEVEKRRLFIPFEQTESGRHSGVGTGLGLAISQEFVRLMGGEITVRTLPDEGSVFRFAIRLERSEAAAIIPEAPVSRAVLHLKPGPSPCRVLIVDDEYENRLLLKEMLGPVGFATCEAANGREAVEQFAEWKPGLILMDLRMPEMDGYEAIRRIRAREDGREVKILILSASAFEENRRDGLAAGGDDFLSKPFRDSILFEKIRTLTGVEYVYGELKAEAPGKRATPLHAESLAGLPGEWIAGMKEAVLIGDFDRVGELIDEMVSLDPLCAQGLRRLAEQFDSKGLIQLLTPPGDNARTTPRL